jgi:RND family efflux transporter MFP subunit
VKIKSASSEKTMALIKKYIKPASIIGIIAAVGLGAAFAFNASSPAPKIQVSNVPTTNKPMAKNADLAPQVEASAKADAPIEVRTEQKPTEQKSDALGCLAVERGDLVSKGQTVASLESRIERASVDLALTKLRNDAEIRSAQSNEEFARKKHERNENLHRDGVVSAQVREQAETEASLAVERLKQTKEARAVVEQEVQLAKSQLSLKTITSPINGMVIERYLSAGERADEKPIIKIAQIDPLRVEAILPAMMYGKVKAGMTAKVTPELQGELGRNAAITLVDKVIDPASNTFRVRLELSNRDYSLPSGVRCKINIAQL